MGADSKIEWCDHTFNPWVGCTRVSPACDHCYAEAWARRTGHPELWQGARRRTTAANWRQPLKWAADAEKAGKRARVFCASLADVFDAEVPVLWRLELFQLISATPALDWLLLTKRPKLMAEFARVQNWPRNAWAGTTIENKKLGAERAWWLAHVPAPVRFWSVEPLLEDLGDLTPLCFYDTALDDRAAVHWIIVGGESGPGARPMQIEWANSLLAQCQAAGVPFFFKQWGEFAPSTEWRDGRRFMARVGKKAAGRALDGREWNEFPQVTRHLAGEQ